MEIFRRRQLSILLSRSWYLFFVALIVQGCDLSFTSPKYYEYEEVITLPSDGKVSPSREIAQFISATALSSLTEFVEDNAEKYDLNEIGCGIQWEEVTNLSSDKSKYHIKVIGRSRTVPLEENQPLKELMAFSIEEVNKNLRIAFGESD